MGKVGILVLCFLSVLTCSLGAADISYEGQLSVHGAPADGWFDFRLQVFDQRDNDGSKAFGGEFLVPGVRVTDGRFSIEISPDADLTGQADLWLEISVKQADAYGDYTALKPRQRLVTPMSAELANKAATIPAGGVVFFQSNVCPAGWSEYVPARGRYVLGVPTGGTLGATYGTPLANLEERNHSHSVSSSATTQMSGSHNHAWSRLFINPAGDRVWTSYNAEGTEVFLINWSNGVGNEGSGYYPLAASPTQTFHTYYSGVHQHDVQVVGSTGEAASYLPYIQLLACRKD